MAGESWQSKGIPAVEMGLINLGGRITVTQEDALCWCLLPVPLGSVLVQCRCFQQPSGQMLQMMK